MGRGGALITRGGQYYKKNTNSKNNNITNHTNKKIIVSITKKNYKDDDFINPLPQQPLFLLPWATPHENTKAIPFIIKPITK